MTEIQQLAFIAPFSCLGPDCPDMCCQGWSMLADDAQLERYRARAPELLEAVDVAEGEMKRNPATEFCEQLQAGMCRIHARYGDAMLGDACHFFPRQLKQIGGTPLMSASLACPEAVRLLLSAPAPMTRQTAEVARLPVKLRNPAPAELSDADARTITDYFLQRAGDASRTPEAVMAELMHASMRLSALPAGEWMAALPSLTEEQLPAPERKAGDDIAAFYGLLLMAAFTQKQPRQRLLETLDAMQRALDCTFDWPTRVITPGSQAGARLKVLRAKHAALGDALAPILRRWIQAQLALLAFPFAGNTTLSARTELLCHHFAVLRLALLCHVREEGALPDEATTIRIIQSISRVMNHLSDAELQTLIYRDAGWTSEARWLGLVG